MASVLADPNKPFEADIPENMQRRGALGVGGDAAKGAMLGAKIGTAVPVVGNVAGLVIGGIVGLTKGLVQGAINRGRRRRETGKQKQNWTSMRKNMDASLRRSGTISSWDPAKAT